MIDRCTRWHAAMVIQGKTEEDCTAALDELWFSTHGPLKKLIMDGKSGVVRSEVCNKFLERRGVRLHSRGKEQHARFIERRVALLRDTILRIEGQLKEEGIEPPFKSVLGEATSCGNALLSINGSTPHNAVSVRVLHVLLSIDQVVLPDADREKPRIRHTPRS